MDPAKFQTRRNDRSPIARIAPTKAPLQTAHRSPPPTVPAHHQTAATPKATARAAAPLDLAATVKRLPNIRITLCFK